MPRGMAMNVLVLNAGSATLKFRLLSLRGAADERAGVVVDGGVDRWGTPAASLKIAVEGRATERRAVAAESPGRAAEIAIEACAAHAIDAIRDVARLAPLHNDNALAGIEAGLRLLPDVPAGAVFDTAFHRTIPDVAAHYAIPRELAERHALRRYGFHGISHRYVSQRLLKCLGRDAVGTRLITAHLGNGASICAIRDGKSIDTSMGLTPMEGLVMGTRSGDVDPGLVLHLTTALGMSPED